MSDYSATVYRELSFLALPPTCLYTDKKPFLSGISTHIGKICLISRLTYLFKDIKNKLPIENKNDEC